MGLQKISFSQALSSGHELWILPSSEDAPIVRKIDWYLNFQLARAKNHRPENLSPEIRNILAQNEWPEFKFGKDSSMPLMVAPQGLLPTNMVVQIPNSAQLPQWAANAKKVWLALGKPSLRLFLPEAGNLNNLIELWGSDSSSNEIAVVPAR